MVYKMQLAQLITEMDNTRICVDALPMDASAFMAHVLVCIRTVARRGNTTTVVLRTQENIIVVVTRYGENTVLLSTPTTELLLALYSPNTNVLKYWIASSVQHGVLL